MQQCIEAAELLVLSQNNSFSFKTVTQVNAIVKNKSLVNMIVWPKFYVLNYIVFQKFS